MAANITYCRLNQLCDYFAAGAFSSFTALLSVIIEPTRLVVQKCTNGLFVYGSRNMRTPIRSRIVQQRLKLPNATGAESAATSANCSFSAMPQPSNAEGWPNCKPGCHSHSDQLTSHFKQRLCLSMPISVNSYLKYYPSFLLSDLSLTLDSYKQGTNMGVSIYYSATKKTPFNIEEKNTFVLRN